MTLFNTYAEAKAVMMHQFREGLKGSIFQVEDQWAYQPVKFQAGFAKPACTPISGNWDPTAIK